MIVVDQVSEYSDLRTDKSIAYIQESTGPEGIIFTADTVEIPANDYLYPGVEVEADA